jgi:hypothetical protein
MPVISKAHSLTELKGRYNYPKRDECLTENVNFEGYEFG